MLEAIRDSLGWTIHTDGHTIHIVLLNAEGKRSTANIREVQVRISDQRTPDASRNGKPYFMGNLCCDVMKAVGGNQKHDGIRYTFYDLGELPPIQSSLLLFCSESSVFKNISFFVLIKPS